MTTAFAPAQGWSPGPRRPATPPDVGTSGATVIEIRSQRAPEPALSWLDRVVERINAIARLEPGWDGERAEPPTTEAALALFRGLLEVMWPDSPAPSVVPMYDGGIQAEWHTAGLDIELSVGPDGSRHVWLAAGSGLEIDDDFRYVVEDLRKHIGTLTRG